MSKVLYKPFGLAVGAIAGLSAGKLFRSVWKLVDRDDEAPKATQKHRGWAEVLLASALQGAIFGAVQALFDRAGATGFEKATGVWPGDE